MAHVTLILGGCRSGKSGFALKTANETKADRRIFIATAVALDDEIRARVKQHRAERGAGWMTVEAPLALAEAVAEHAGQGCVILVDCLTLWVSNLLLELQDPAKVVDRIAELVRAVRAAACPVILVSNEVGSGIVPENQLARRFRDLAGTANQAVAACADTVVWTVAGIPVVIKKP
ncbi:MAG: bifunctional adenosylcobinamide kinase/adenosylcobinamide-phosphate guanylyltransferase [Hyphomicrobiales bacterium]